MNLILSVKSFALPAAAAFLLTVSSCGTYHVQKGADLKLTSKKTEAREKIFLVGNADFSQKEAEVLKAKLDSAGASSSLIFLGNEKNIAEKDSLSFKDNLKNLAKITQNFKGKTFVISSENNWKTSAKDFEKTEKQTEKILGKTSFLPEKCCPISKVKISENTVLIAVDSQWVLQNWDEKPGINKDCDIKTREEFYTELRDEITKNQSENIILAIHHPVVSGGVRNGFAAADFAGIFNFFKSASGMDPQYFSNEKYAQFAARIRNIIQGNDRITVVSAHEGSLEYHAAGSIRQLVSGAFSTKNPAAKLTKNDFTFGGKGFISVDFFADGSEQATFFGDEKNENFATFEVRPKTDSLKMNFPTEFPKTVHANIYSEKETHKSVLYKMLWGDYYREIYSKKITVPVADLSEMGFTAIREGGGNQSNTLRLKSSENQEFAMRAIRKDAVRFLNKVAFKTSTFGDELSNTFADRFVSDFYTSSHPYTPFAVSEMTGKIGIMHSNPQLFYVPKQQNLGNFNKNFGDGLYMIEERLSADKKTLAEVGNAEDILSTDDVLKELQKNSKSEVATQEYVRARIFDILIGDWDRHSDQWKWAQFTENGRKIFRPIPRDRDQAFSKYDGILLQLIMTLPDLRHMQSFKQKIRNVKWLEREPYPIDLVFAKNSTENDWISQAKFIAENLTDKDIDEAFKNLPKEAKDAEIDDIKQKLKQRKTDLQKYAAQYYKVLQEKVQLAGTEKKDRFIITKYPDSVRVTQSVEKKDGDFQEVFSRIYKKGETKDLWIFGLNGDDIFQVEGTGNPGIRIKLAGGYNHDEYRISNGKNVEIFDFKSQKNSYQTDAKTVKKISDRYDDNTYFIDRPKYSYFQAGPNIGYNPDDGVILGGNFSYTKNGFIRKPFSQKHTLKANVYTATGGFNAAYSGIFKQAFGSWDFNLDAAFTTPHFTQNFFGLSNASAYDERLYEKEYNRARIQQFSVKPSVSHTSWGNFAHQFYADFEQNKTERTDGRFILISKDIRPEVFENQKFAGAGYTFSYKNLNDNSFPTLGMRLLLNAEWKTNLSEKNRNFLTLKGFWDLDHRLNRRGTLVFANHLSAMWINNQNFEFYQAADIGGEENLRAYRKQRFSGNSFLVNSSEVRWNFGNLKNSVLPASWGIAVGADAGRVWNRGEISEKWHASYGGGVWLNVLDQISARANCFTGEDGARISFGIGMGF